MVVFGLGPLALGLGRRHRVKSCLEQLKKNTKTKDQRPKTTIGHSPKGSLFMPVTISIPTALRQFAGGQLQIEVEARTAGEALAQLTSAHAELRRHLFSDQNVLRNFVNVYVNDQDIRHSEGPETPVKDGDTMMIVPAIAGGAVMEPELKEALPELSNEEIARYSRHLIMPEVGMQGQRRLKAASVLMIGTGGLGVQVGIYF